MKKRIVLFNLMLILMLSIAAPLVSVFADGEDEGTNYLVTSNGIVTSHKVATEQCDFLVDFSEQMKEKRAEKKIEDKLYESDGMFDIIGKINEFIIDTGVGAIVWMSDTIINMGEWACEKEALSFMDTFFNQTKIFTKNVNITYIANLMSITGIVQWLSLMGMTFLILYNGWKAMTGAFIDPLMMIVRFGAAMLLIYLAPYLLQDILGINNLIVHQLSKMSVVLDGMSVKIEEVVPASFGVVLFQIQDMMVSVAGEEGGVVAQLAFLGGIGTIILWNVLLALIVIIAVLPPLIKIISWWYVRYFKIFLYTVISPIMFMSFATKETENTGYNFIRNYSILVFEQFFMVLGIGIMGVFITTILPVMNALGLGVIGYAIAFYSAVKFLSELPGMLDSWFRGSSGVKTGRNLVGEGFQGSRSTMRNTTKRFNNQSKQPIARTMPTPKK